MERRTMSKPQLDPITAQPVAADVPLGIDELLVRLGLGAAFGIAVGASYFLTQRKRRAESASFVSTLVLLSILLAMVSMVIGSDIARAFSLVGALAIVRFRTVVEDTRDTAFVIFAVIAGMAAGAGAYRVAALGIPIVAAMAWLLRLWGGNGNGVAKGPHGKLVVRLGIGSDPNGPLAETLRKHTVDTHLVSVATARQGAAVDLTYALQLNEEVSPLALTADLNRIEGVQAVEWSEGKKDE
jgi:uncharacterized protein DUF4956